jgi:flavin-dependent dehydrogenase
VGLFFIFTKNIDMTDVYLYSKISTLPPSLKKEVSDFIEFLQTKKAKSLSKKKRVFGYAKGSITIKPGFDDPLEDFKEYM